MTSRTTDMHCDHCGKYTHSLWPSDPIPPHNTCKQCKAQGLHGTPRTLNEPTYAPCPTCDGRGSVPLFDDPTKES